MHPSYLLVVKITRLTSVLLWTPGLMQELQKQGSSKYNEVPSAHRPAIIRRARKWRHQRKNTFFPNRLTREIYNAELYL